MDKMIKKLYKFMNKEKKRNPDSFYFDEGKVCENKDYIKDNVLFSVMRVNTDCNTNHYLVYLLVNKNKKTIPQLLMKSFSSKYGTRKYFNELCTLVENNSNQTIISTCFSEVFSK